MLEIKNPHVAATAREIFNAGAQAYHEAVVKWMNELCSDHPKYWSDGKTKVMLPPIIKRICPECWREFTGGK